MRTRSAQHVDLLCRHVALTEQDRAPAGLVLGHVEHQHRMAGKAALNEHIPGLNVAGIGHTLQFALQRIGSRVDEHNVQIAPE